VAADLENGFAHDPAGVAETIRRAAAAGLVGGSIEDATGDPADPIYAFEAAVERVAAAAEAAHALPFRFTLTARAENFLHGRPDLADTIRRLVAFEAAGADVLYAPGLTTEAEIRAVCSAVRSPVNVLAGSPALRASVADLSTWGVRRVSLGGNLARTAINALIGAATEIRDQGTFGYGVGVPGFPEINKLMDGMPG
jgi:2-methylisocitrate lyase-like PEP mutase family enzyme